MKKKFNENNSAKITGILLGLGAIWWALGIRSKRAKLALSQSSSGDKLGHYDIDGVSFDGKFGVVVSSDARIPNLLH